LAANEDQSAIYLAALAISDLVFLLFDGAALVTGSAGVRFFWCISTLAFGDAATARICVMLQQSE